MPDGDRGLAARRTGQELAQRDDVGEDRLVEPAAALDELGPVIAEMRHRPAERGQPQPKKDAQHLEAEPRGRCAIVSLAAFNVLASMPPYHHKFLARLGSPPPVRHSLAGAHLRPQPCCAALHVLGAAALRGLRLWMWPLSVPAVGSMTALISAGLPEASASLSALVRLGVSVQ